MPTKKELTDALIDMLEQFGWNYSISCVENACALLQHPITQPPIEIDKKEYGADNDCCYCRSVVYSKKEAKRRKKLKMQFIDRT